MTVIASRSISVLTGTFLSLGPLFKASILACLASFLIVWASNEETMNNSAIYSGIFDLASIFTGFLATFYVFVVTKGNKFLEKIESTNTHRMVLTLLKFTVLWSSFVIGLSYLLMVFNPIEIAFLSAMHGLVFFWLWNMFIVLVNFVRCVVLFMSIVEV